MDAARSRRRRIGAIFGVLSLVFAVLSLLFLALGEGHDIICRHPSATTLQCRLDSWDEFSDVDPAAPVTSSFQGDRNQHQVELTAPGGGVFRLGTTDGEPAARAARRIEAFARSSEPRMRVRLPWPTQYRWMGWAGTVVFTLLGAWFLWRGFRRPRPFDAEPF